MANYMKDLVLENVPIMFKNFSGKAGKFNAEGDRNFCVILEEDVADQLREDGWNVKTSIPKNPDYGPTYYIKVSVSYRAKPPKIVLIVNGKQTQLDEDGIAALDYAEIIRNQNQQQVVDVILHPYVWEVNGKTGIKAYLKSLYATMEDDPLARKYEAMGEDEDDEDKLPF